MGDSEFYEQVFQKVLELREPLQLRNVERGEDVIAEAEPAPFTDSLRPRILRICDDSAELQIGVRNVAYVGSMVSLTNRLLAQYWRQVVPASRGLDELPLPARNRLVDLAQNQFLDQIMSAIKARRTVDDLLGLFVLTTNIQCSPSSAALDPRDGEIFVEVVLQHDGQNIPAAFEDSLRAVLGHAERIISFERTLAEVAGSTRNLSGEQLDRIVGQVIRELQHQTKEANGDGSRSEKESEEELLL
jgi:hypothetical protein